MPTSYYKSENKDFTLLKGDCIELLNSFDFKFDMILLTLLIIFPMEESVFKAVKWYLSIRAIGTSPMDTRKITCLINLGFLLAGIS